MFNNKIKFLAFSIVELMIAVTIIGILSAIAVPAYNDYRIKALATEGLSVLDSLKQKSLEFYNQNAALPASLSDVNSTSNAYTTSTVSSVHITSAGVIQVIFSSVVPCLTCTGASGATAGATLHLVPLVPASGASSGTSVISWKCCSESMFMTYLPGGCSFNSNCPN